MSAVCSSTSPTEAGILDPEQLSDELRLVYDGGSIAANLDHNPSDRLRSPCRPRGS
jgi:hypothetical protein